MAKAVDEKVKAKIIEAAKAKTPYREIAKKYGVAAATVSVLARNAGIRARAVRGSKNGVKTPKVRGKRSAVARAMATMPAIEPRGIVTSQASYEYAVWLVGGVNQGFIEIA